MAYTLASYDRHISSLLYAHVSVLTHEDVYIAARLLLLCDARCPIYDLHEKLQWDTLATRATKALVRIIYSCINNKLPTSLYDSLTLVDHQGRFTRATEAGVLMVPRNHSNFGEMPFGYRAPTQWNTIKLELKAAVNVQ